MPKLRREIRPDVFLSLDHPEAQAGDLLIAEVLCELVVERGKPDLQLEEADMDEIIRRCQLRGFDATTGTWLS